MNIADSPAFHFFKQFIANLRAELKDGVATVEGKPLPRCPTCDRPLVMAYGRHNSTYYLTHPLPAGGCPDWARSWHSGAKTEAEAVDGFWKAENK